MYVALSLLFTTAPPVIITYPESIMVTRPDAATFHCATTGQPRPAIIWFRDGEPIPHGSEQYIINESLVPDDTTSLNSTLIIPNTNYKYTGVYSCFMNNEDGNSSAGATLSVLGV